MGKKSPKAVTKVLDTTLRDGSYAVGFQFTAADTASIAEALEKAGVALIEIGHGVGLNASKRGYGEAAESDEGYLKAASRALKKATFGMFCIPGIARLEDIDMAADYGMGFIRIGTDVTRVQSSKAFIARAKKHGMFVSANLMKSYAMEPKKFARQARLTEQFGSDLLCVVDSAGGMLAGDLERYFEAVRDVSRIPLAFHGHNNLGLAVAHTLRAVELGAVIVDGSLQGMGRGAGNTPTEILVVTLKRMGIDVGIDPLAVMDIGEKYVRPLIRRRGIGCLDVMAGYAQFHSSYMGTIRHYSSKYHVDPRKLILGVSQVDKVDASPALVERVAQRLRNSGEEVFTAKYDFDEYIGHEQDGFSKR